jgi:hypothetical protein
MFQTTATIAQKCRFSNARAAENAVRPVKKKKKMEKKGR